VRCSNFERAGKCRLRCPIASGVGVRRNRKFNERPCVKISLPFGVARAKSHLEKTTMGMMLACEIERITICVSILTSRAAGRESKSLL
jgi:hypothetical protein